MSDLQLAKTFNHAFQNVEENSEQESFEDGCEVPEKCLEQLYISEPSFKSIPQAQSGRVKENYKNGSSYEGEKKNGMRHGKGRFTYEDGAYYEG